MKGFRVSHLVDAALTREMAAGFRGGDESTAWTLARIGEWDARRLYLQAGYTSTLQCCIELLRRTRPSALKRIRAARIAHQHPAVLEYVANGKLTLTAVLLLGVHLTSDNADELLAAAVGMNTCDLECWLADRFAVRSDADSLALSNGRVAARPLGMTNAEQSEGEEANESIGGAGHDAREVLTLIPPEARPAVLPVPLPPSTHEKLAYARARLGHAIPSGDVAAVPERCLDLAIESLERAKFGVGARSRVPRRSATRRGDTGTPRSEPTARHIPTAVRREVFARDGGRCTFVGDTGHRCESRVRLEFDHVQPVARGGTSTAGNPRLRCRAHNQLEAERAFGAEFVRARREAARARSDAERAHGGGACRSIANGAGARSGGDTALGFERGRDAAVAEHFVDGSRWDADATRAAERARRAAVEEVVPTLRNLGCSLAEAREAAAICATIPHAPLEERLRLVLRGDRAAARRPSALSGA